MHTFSTLTPPPTDPGRPRDPCGAGPPSGVELPDSAGGRVWRSFRADQFEPKTGEQRLTLGVRASIESDFSFGPNEEVVLDAEWDSATISQETAAPGVYFVSAIITITNDVTGGWDFLEVEPIMITVTASSGDSGPAGDAP